MKSSRMKYGFIDLNEEIYANPGKYWNYIIGGEL
jgi:hypothetical protein